MLWFKRVFWRKCVAIPLLILGSVVYRIVSIGGFDEISWGVFPPIVWTIWAVILILLVLYGFWRFGSRILAGACRVFRWFKRALLWFKRVFWRKRVVIPVLILSSLVVWRAWPLVLIFTGLNMDSSNNFRMLVEHLPPERPATEIYAGLSHPRCDDDFLKEILLGPRKIIHGHGFKPKRIAPNEVTEAVINHLWSGKAFEPWRGEKMCGGFHADYCLRWESNDGQFDVMICLGCSEALLFRDGEALRCDLQSDFWHLLRDLTKPNR
jgi:hypothetical protein